MIPVEYFNEMRARNRMYTAWHGNRLAAFVTFFVGDDDEKYMIQKEPFVVVEDSRNGRTLYIDVLFSHGVGPKLSSMFSDFEKWVAIEFPRVKQIKWVRVGADFRKHSKGVTHEYFRRVL